MCHHSEEHVTLLVDTNISWHTKAPTPLLPHSPTPYWFHGRFLDHFEWVVHCIFCILLCELNYTEIRFGIPHDHIMNNTRLMCICFLYFFLRTTQKHSCPKIWGTTRYVSFFWIKVEWQRRVQTNISIISQLCFTFLKDDFAEKKFNLL